MPLYVVEQGIDEATLGVILAAWPAARLLAEPFFGWLADRVPRRPLMLVGLAGLGIFSALPLAFPEPMALFALRFLGGAFAAMYDPAARGTIVDATAEDERGEAFGLFSAASMGGLIFGPAIGSFGAAIVGGFGFPFVLTAVMCVAAAIYLGVALRGRPLRAGEASGPGQAPIVESSNAELGSDSPELARRTGERLERDPRPRVVAPWSAFLNRPFLAALTLNFGLYCSVGVYEVTWSLFMEHLGADLALIGFTFTLFGIPVLLLAPFAGKLVDRRGATRFAFAPMAVLAACGIAYTLITAPVLTTPVIVVESAANAFLGPALFAILAIGTPAGRSATAQGLFGSAGTVAFIVSSAASGVLFAIDPRYPFYFFTAAIVGSVTLAAVIWFARRLPATAPAVVPGDA
jgi:MFS family permease